MKKVKKLSEKYTDNTPINEVIKEFSYRLDKCLYNIASIHDMSADTDDLFKLLENKNLNNNDKDKLIKVAEKYYHCYIKILTNMVECNKKSCMRLLYLCYKDNK